MTDLLAELRKPFDPEQIRWRVGSTTKDKKKGMALAYIDARDVMNRLDDVMGTANWMDEYSQGPEGIVFCKLSIRLATAVLVDDKGVSGGEWFWISKMDGAGRSDIEADKGAVSGALKRAAVKYGIGRYLYDLASPWVQIEQRGKSSTIVASEKPKLLAVLKGAAEPPVVPTHEGVQISERLSRLIRWCNDNHVTREMVFQFLGFEDLGTWSDLEERDMDAISEQAKLVMDGMPPDEAFGRTNEQRAAELTDRIDGADLSQFDADPGGEKGDGEDKRK